MVRSQPNKYLLSFRGKSHHSGAHKADEKIGKNKTKQQQTTAAQFKCPKSSQAEFIGTLSKTGGSAYEGEYGES